MLKNKANIPINALWFLIVLSSNFLLFRQNFLQKSAGGGSIYLIFGLEGIILLIAILRFSSRKKKLAALSGLIACAIGFIFELVLLINGIGLFGLRIN